MALLDEAGPKYVLILAGDHIYKMDYTRLLADHVNSAADLTMACIELPLQDVTGFGVISVDEGSRVTAFEEKPANPVPVSYTHLDVYKRQVLCCASITAKKRSA